VDERDAALNATAANSKGQAARAGEDAGITPFSSSIGSTKMATSAAVRDDEPATKFAKDQLKSIIERIERLEEEKKAISDDIRDVYAESKGNGFDVKALRAIVRMRKQDPNERAEAETILETYMQALGML
jgi:uncharacterized protein (UPF0335 family)